MTIASNVNRNNYTGNGTTEVYNYTFRIFNEEDLRVTVRDADGVETLLALTTDYTVSGEGEEGGGQITLVDSNQDWLDAEGDLASGYVITIRRVRDITQETDIRNQGDFFPEVHEDAFDGFTMVDQQQQDEIDRSVKLAETVDPLTFDTDLPAALVGSVNKTLMTNAAGDGFEVGPTADEVSNAQGYAEAALASELAAADSEAAAALSETNAGNSEDAAFISETNADASEANAAASASAAAGSASAAATSASTATTQASNASASATAASGSATAAAGSATSASTSASNAATSETNAAASAAAASLVVAGILTSADTNDNTSGDIIALSTASIGSVRLTNAGVTALSGIANGANGRMVFINNATGVVIPVGHLASGASSANRIWCPGATPISWKPNTILFFKYDSTLGNWKVVGGSGDAGSGSGLETLMQKLELEKSGSITEALDNSCGASGKVTPYHKNFVARLIQSESSGVSTLYMVHNPVVVNDSDKDYDSTTSWTAVGDAASLATSATGPKVGTNKFTFNKGTGATTAGIRYDRSSQNLNLGVNTRAWFWVNMPSVTNLTNIYLRIYADSTSNYRTFSCTSDYAGNALAVGWNLCFVDISTGGSASGTGWLYTQMSRYVEIGVTASSSGQAYTAIAFGGLWFSYGNITELGLIDKELTIYDTTKQENILIASSNTRPDGPATLASATANAWTAGIAVAAAAGIQRSTLSFSSETIGFDTALASGTISTTQDLRLSTIHRESLAENLKAFIDVATPQFYRVTAVPGGTTCEIEDAGDSHLNLLSADNIDIFDIVWNNGQRFFQYTATKALSANSSYSSGTTTLTFSSSSGISAGQYVAKRHHTLKLSCVGKTTNESFSAPTLSTTPNGVQVIDSGIFYPNKASLVGHWWLGGVNTTEAFKNRAGIGDFSLTGSLNSTDTFLKGRQSLSGFPTATSGATSNYLSQSIIGGTYFDADGEMAQGSFWVYYVTTSSQYRTLLGAGYQRYSDNTRAGWRIGVNSSSANVDFSHGNGGTSDIAITATGLVANAWNHIAFSISESGTLKQIWLNGVLTTGGAPSIQASSGTIFYLGCNYDANNSPTTATPADGLKMADLMLWRDGPILTTAQVQTLYSGGSFTPVGFSPRVRYVYELNGQTAQKTSLYASLTRSTTAVSPVILKTGTIKV